MHVPATIDDPGAESSLPAEPGPSATNTTQGGGYAVSRVAKSSVMAPWNPQGGKQRRLESGPRNYQCCAASSLSRPSAMHVHPCCNVSVAVDNYRRNVATVFPSSPNSVIQPLGVSAHNPLIVLIYITAFSDFEPVFRSEIGARNDEERVECGREQPIGATGEVRSLTQEPPTTRGGRARTGEKKTRPRRRRLPHNVLNLLNRN